MENNVLCYVKRSLITKWKRLVLTHDDPLFVYGSNDKHVFASQLKDGGVLWIIASIPGRSPELVARMDVEMVRAREDPELGINPRFIREFKFDWIAKGKDSSEFFGHNNAESALLQSAFQPKNGKPWKIDEGATRWRGEYGKKLQSPRLICQEGEFEDGLFSTGTKPFMELKKKQLRAIFLSWKWCDNKKTFMRSLAYELVAQGFMPWLDLLAMPWSQELSEVEQEKPKLGRLLKYGYHHSSAIIAIDTENYGTTNWTKWEWQGKFSKQNKPKKIAYRPKGKMPSKLIADSENNFQVVNKSHAEFASELSVWFDNNMPPP